jgi:hypothetical protein
MAGGERNVTTKFKRRLEEKTSSSSLPSPTSPSPTPSPNLLSIDDERPKSEMAERIDLIRESTGLAPDRRLVREIIEPHSWCDTLRTGLDDLFGAGYPSVSLGRQLNDSIV